MADARDWAGELGEKWASRIEPMDRQLAPANPFGLAALDARPGERIIDLGCGGGPTSLVLADQVGAAGQVLGIDLSPDLLAVARHRADGVAQLSFVEADAARYPFQPGTWDALFSRFGCMFFDEPVAAMTALRRALRPGGRVALMVWAEPSENDWAMIPARAAAEVLGPAEKLAPGAPGPFGWCSPDIFEPILAEAGFRELSFPSHSFAMPLSTGSDPDPVERAIEQTIGIGPLASRLKEAPEALAEIRPLLAKALSGHVRDNTVYLTGTIRVISARV